MLWPEEFAKFEDKVRDDRVVFVKGTLDRRRDPAELVVTRIIPIDQAAAELSRGIVVTLRKGIHEVEQIGAVLHRAWCLHPAGHVGTFYLEFMGADPCPPRTLQSRLGDEATARRPAPGRARGRRGIGQRSPLGPRPAHAPVSVANGDEPVARATASPRAQAPIDLPEEDESDL